jgi:competence protein ComFC
MPNLLDFVFPKKCVICKIGGSYLCEKCFTLISFDPKSLCLVCNQPSFNNLTHPRCRKRYAIDGCFSALPYSKTVQKLIYNFKYKPYLTDLKTVLADLFYESIIQNEQFNKQIQSGEWVFVPVPLSDIKFRKRGYNQAEILAGELTKKFSIPISNFLKRSRETKTQVGMTNVQRKLNVKNVFEITNLIPRPRAQDRGESSIKNQSYFLVDDVVTSGSTLLEAAKVLKKNGAEKVFGLTLARD